ncbi:MAG: antitoxin VapB family protein [Candidatus Bathyarchaeia archaeon]
MIGYENSKNNCRGSQKQSQNESKISILEEAHDRRSTLKRPGESFSDVVNRLARGRSILELAGTLTEVGRRRSLGT